MDEAVNAQPIHSPIAPEEPAALPGTLPSPSAQGAPASVTGSMRPIAEPERIHTMDVLRGFAIFGIFMVNILLFAKPLSSLLDPTRMKDADDGDRIVHAVTRVFFEYKFVSLFSLLFGAGLVMQAMRAQQRGAPFTPLYLRRTFILMAFGLCHGLLLWYGDILFIYSCTALTLMWFHRASARALLISGAALIALSVCIAAAMGALGVLTADFGGTSEPVPAVATAPATIAQSQPEPATPTTQPDPQAGAPADSQPATHPAAEPGPPAGSWEAFMDAFTHISGQPDDPNWDRAEIIAYKEGPMAATLLMRGLTFGMMLIFAVVFGGFGPRVLGMFLIGMALMKLGFFTAKWRTWHVFLAIFGLGLGITAEIFVVSVHHVRQYQFGWPELGAEVVHHVASFILCLGYLGAWAIIVEAGLFRWLTSGLAAVGRMAFTNYLGQTVIATYLMYWWGLGWFNDVSRPQQVAIVVTVYACQMIGSVLWLKVFTIGPAEWVWRSLTYLKPQPVLRRPPSAVGE
jgi:uncharacterized protein